MTNQWVKSPPIAPIRQPSAELQQLVDAQLQTWNGCFSPSAVAQINRIIDDMTRHEQFASIDAKALHPHRQPQRSQDHLVPSMEDYSEPVRICLRAGFTLHIDSSGKPRVTTAGTLEQDAWGFNAKTLRRESIKISWPGKELTDLLQTGGTTIHPSHCQYRGLHHKYYQYTSTGMHLLSTWRKR